MASGTSAADSTTKARGSGAAISSAVRAPMLSPRVRTIAVDTGDYAEWRRPVFAGPHDGGVGGAPAVRSYAWTFAASRSRPRPAAQLSRRRPRDGG